MREFRDEILLRGGKYETWEKRIFSENEQIGNSCRDSTDKTQDLSLDLG